MPCFPTSAACDSQGMLLAVLYLQGVPYPAGGALPAAHDLLGAGWARGRPGTRLLRHQGAGEGAAPERWARGWLGMPTMRRVPVRGTPTGEGTRFESTGLWQAPGLRGCC